jgi:hypothetical protein
MALLISDRIQRYTIFHGYIRTIPDKISGNELSSTWPRWKDKRELYILSYGTQKPPRKAQAIFIWIYNHLCRKFYKLMLLYYQWEIRQNIYPQPNLIRSVSVRICYRWTPISYSYPHTIRSDSESEKNIVMNMVSLLSVRIRSVFTPRTRVTKECIWGGGMRGREKRATIYLWCCK